MCGRKGIMFVKPLILLGPMLSLLQYSISLTLQNSLEGKALSPFTDEIAGTRALWPTCLGVLALARPCAIQGLAPSVCSASASSRTAFLKEECTELWFPSR